MVEIVQMIDNYFAHLFLNNFDATFSVEFKNFRFVLDETKTFLILM